MPAKVELSAEDQAAADEAFDDFEPTDDEIEGAADDDEGGDDAAVETGGETLDDDESEDDGSKTNGVDEGAEARTDSSPKGETERPRDEKGKFQTKDGQQPGKAAADAATEAAKPKWEKLSVVVDKKALPIDEAVITRANGHHMLAVKDADFPRFQQRLQRAVVADQMWRGLQDAVVALEEQRAIDAEGPKSQTDKEIEAETIVDFLNQKVNIDGVETTRMAQIVTKQEIDWLADRVARKQLEHKAKYQTDRQEFTAKRQQEQQARAAEGEEPETQIKGIGQILGRMSDANDMEFPQEVKDVFKSITEPEMRAVFGAMMPIRRSLFWKEGKEWFSNTQLILDTAKDAIAKVRAATPGTPGTPAKPNPKATRAERLNKGSTALKNNRAPLTPGKTGTPKGRKDEPQENSHTRAQKAETDYRKATRSFMNSPGFDLDVDDDE